MSVITGESSLNSSVPLKSSYVVSPQPVKSNAPVTTESITIFFIIFPL